MTLEEVEQKRKRNPLGQTDAYTRALRPGDGARLLLRGINGDRHPLELERLRDAAAGREDVVVMDGYLDAGAKDGLMCKCEQLRVAPAWP